MLGNHSATVTLLGNHANKPSSVKIAGFPTEGNGTLLCNSPAKQGGGGRRGRRHGATLARPTEERDNTTQGTEAQDRLRQHAQSSLAGIPRGQMTFVIAETSRAAPVRGKNSPARA